MEGNIFYEVFMSVWWRKRSVSGMGKKI